MEHCDTFHRDEHGFDNHVIRGQIYLLGAAAASRKLPGTESTHDFHLGDTGATTELV